MIAGTHSGCGKTTMALALMAACKARGLKVQPFKVGPDFIDPGFHTQLTGRPSRNLDGWMLSRIYNRELFLRLLEESDLAIVEGVMGLFDGYDGTGEAGSSAEMAKWLELPVILVVDARSMARSAAALVFGFTRFDPQVKIAGVVFNRVGGSAHLQYLKEAMTACLPDVPVLGGIPREEKITIPERHLGLVTSDEIFIDKVWEENLVRLVEEYLDLDLILKRAEVPENRWDAYSSRFEKPHRDTISVAVARDAAFCFYYPDNLELLQRAGAHLYFFSPLAGEPVPDRVGGLYLGGGYPELYGAQIGENGLFLYSVREAAKRGMPIYAECGGLMTLGRFIETHEQERYPMAGILPFGTRMLKRRKALGYTEVVLTRDCLLGEKGLHLRGHEFHYSEIVEHDYDPSLALSYLMRERKYQRERHEGYTVGSVLASYVHLHWGSAPRAAEAFVGKCREFLERTTGR